jgi:hypothetical protein
MKIDVEGYEIDVLTGAQRILKMMPALALEMHIFMYSDKAASIAEVFRLISLSSRSAHIQLTVNGPIVAYQPTLHTPNYIQNFEVVHLFCS